MYMKNTFQYQDGNHEPLITLSSLKMRLFLNSFIYLTLYIFITSRAVGSSIRFGGSTKDVSEVEVCRTITCVNAATSIKATADLDANPCKDFYQFACGKKWSRTLRARSTEEAWMNENQLIRNLARESDNPNMVALSNYYSSCVERNKQNFNHLLNLIRKFDIDERDISLSDVVNRLSVDIQLEGFQNPFLNAYTTIKIPNTSKIYIKLEPRKFSTQKNFADLIEILELDHLKDKELVAGLESIRHKLIEIVKDLSEPKPEFISIDELNSVSPSIKWDLVLSRLYDNDGLEGLNGSQQIIVTHRDYLSQLSKLLVDLAPRDLKYFLILQMIDEAATFSNDKLARLASQTLPRKCDETLKEHLGFLFSFEYGKHYVSQERRSSVLKMLDRIKFELDSELMSLDWLDSDTKMRARNKVANMKALIAYPDEFLNGSLLDQVSGHFKKQNFVGDSFLRNVLALKRSEHEFDASILHSSYRELPWLRLKDSTSVNAFYEDAFNSVNILAGHLNDQLCDETRPMYLNYALIGSIVGHELVHAFDRNGIRLDDEGDWHIWWSIDSQAAYERRLDCVRQLYDDLQLPGAGFKLNGTKTLDENMADLIGLRLARRAYMKELGEISQDEPRLPSLEQFNGRQLFWLNYGVSWCSSASPSDMAKQYQSDTHSPEPIRVNVPLQNIAEFASDFNCPLGSVMNPTRKRVECDLF